MLLLPDVLPVPLPEAFVFADPLIVFPVVFPVVLPVVVPVLVFAFVEEPVEVGLLVVLPQSEALLVGTFVPLCTSVAEPGVTVVLAVLPLVVPLLLVLPLLLVVVLPEALPALFVFVEPVVVVLRLLPQSEALFVMPLAGLCVSDADAEVDLVVVVLLFDFVFLFCASAVPASSSKLIVAKRMRFIIIRFATHCHKYVAGRNIVYAPKETPARAGAGLVLCENLLVKEALLQS
jgi:hypothetical protein